MEKHKILGLSLLGAGAVAAGLGTFGIVQTLQLNKQTEDTKAKESKAMNNVIDSIYSSTESNAKTMGTASGLLAGAAIAGSLILLTTGGLLLSPLGIKMKQMKLAKLGAISLAVIAGGAPVLGAIGTGLFYTDQVQQAKQFLDFSADFEKEFMGNINAVEDRAREMLDKAEWLQFRDLMVKFDGTEGASAFKITDADKTADPEAYYHHSFVVAANMYVLAGKGLLDGLAGNQFDALKSANYFTDKAFWGTHTDYFDKLNEIKNIRDNFMPVKFNLSDADNKKISEKKLDELETAAVAEASKVSVAWFKEHMKKYNNKFGVEATDKVISLVLAKLAYVSGNKDLSILGAGKLDVDGKAYPTENGIQVLPKSTGMTTLMHGKSTVETKFMIPSSVDHFKNVPGLVLSADKSHFELAEKLQSVIGIEELTSTYKPSWLNDPINYIFTTPGTDRVKIDSSELHNIAANNEFINEDFLKSFFEGHNIYINKNIMMTQFKDLDNAVTQGLSIASMAGSLPAGTAPAGLNGAQKTDPILTVFDAVLKNAKSKPTPAFPANTTHTSSSYFLQMKLTLAKNYVQSVMNDISDTLTNHPTDIYA